MAAGNYITSVSLLVFPNGAKFQNFIDSSLTHAEKTTAQELVITEAENWLDNQLRGRTATPATHIQSACKQIALEYARGMILRDNPIIKDEDREERAKAYFERAEKLLESLRYGASATVPVAAAQNTGNGTISAIAVDDEYPLTEDWIIRCISETEPTFEVVGSFTGELYPYDITDGVYPVQADSERIPEEQRRISFTITAGNVAFAEEDEFTFKTFAPSWGRRLVASGTIELVG